MKKLFAILLSLVMLLSLAACGAKEAPAPTEEAKAEAPADINIIPMAMQEILQPLLVM